MTEETTAPEEEAPSFAPVPAVRGLSVSVWIHDEERTMTAVKHGRGWAIVPSDAEEAAALAALAGTLGPETEEAEEAGEEDQQP